MTDDFDYEQLDPDIRETVRLLREHDFETTDSGDGVTKKDWIEAGEALDFPHVAAATTPDCMIVDAETMARVLGKGWVVEASYSTADGRAILFAREALPGELEANS
jgi:hypothetical protein